MRTPAAALSILLAVSCGGGDRRAPATSGARAASGPGAAPAIVGAERVRVPSIDEELTHGAPTTLDALLFRPSGAGPFAAVVALHECAGLFQPNGAMHPRDHDWAMRLRDAGYLVLWPDSFGARGVTEGCKKSDHPVRPGAERARDAYGALLWLQQQPFARGDRVALMGWAAGAFTTLVTIADKSPARPPVLGHDFRLAIAFYPGCGRILENERWRSKIPVEMFVGELDDTTPAAPCIQLTERSRAAGMTIETVVYHGAYHDFDAPDTPLKQRGKSTTGTEPTARADAIQRVEAALAQRLAPDTANADAGP